MSDMNNPQLIALEIRRLLDNEENKQIHESMDNEGHFSCSNNVAKARTLSSRLVELLNNPNQYMR